MLIPPSNITHIQRQLFSLLLTWGPKFATLKAVWIGSGETAYDKAVDEVRASSGEVTRVDSLGRLRCTFTGGCKTRLLAQLGVTKADTAGTEEASRRRNARRNLFIIVKATIVERYPK